MDFDISIIMPSYNQGDYIEEAIRSVLCQRRLSIQLIIMDGGSSDQTIRILSKYSGLIQFESQPDRGQSHALNKALALARAPIIGWLNSDDKYLPGAFSRVLKVFALNQDVALVHGQRVLIDSSSQVVGWVKDGPFLRESRRFNICSETAFWRRDCISGHRFREDLQFAMDTHFLGLISSRLKTLYLPVFIGCFRCHGDSKSSNLWSDYAIPESTSVWMQIFGHAIDHSQPLKSESSAFNKFLDFALLPLPIAASYIWGRLRRCRLSGSPKV